MRRKSIFFRYFISYLGIGLILVSIFGVIFYYYNILRLDTEVKNSHISATLQSMNKIDYLIESMTNIAYHFSSTQLDDGYTLYQEKEHELIIVESLISQRLSNYEENLIVPMRLMLYFRGDTEIYLNDGRCDYKVFEDQEKYSNSLNMSRLFSTINSTTKRKTIKMINGFTNLESDNTSAAFVYPIPYMSTIPEASLVFFIKDSEFQDIFDNFAGDMERNIYLLDNTLQMVYQSEANELTEAEILELVRMKGTGVFELKVQGKPMMAIRALSNNSGFSSIILMKEDVFFSRVSLMKKVVGICLVLFSLLSLLLALLMAMRNYRPIRSLADIVLKERFEGEEETEEITAGHDELDIIRERVETTREKNLELIKLVDLQRPYVVLTCIANILNGKIDDEQELEFQMQCANIHFSKGYYFVLLIIPDNKENPSRSIQQIITVTESLHLEKHTLYSTEIIQERQVAVIVNSHEMQVNTVSVDMYFADLFQDLLAHTYYLKVSIGIGSIYSHIKDIHKSFLEAVVVFNEYITASSGTIVRFEDIPAQGQVDYSISFAEQSLFLQALKQGDKAIALQSVNKIIDEISNIDGSFLLTQYQCVNVMNILIKAASQIDGDIHLSDLRKLNRYENLEEFRINIREMTESICERYDQIKEKKRNKLSADVIRYVNENYKDNNLSLADTASRFELSSTYLSRFFKQATGRTFIQYITDLRMNYVKEQLITTDKQIKDIVVSAGYLDVASFVRKFKTVEGVTPGQYRQETSSQS